jgi:hypothetical protein
VQNDFCNKIPSKADKAMTVRNNIHSLLSTLVHRQGALVMNREWRILHCKGNCSFFASQLGGLCFSVRGLEARVY